MFAFIPTQNIKSLKSLKLVFQSLTVLNDPFILNSKVHRSHQETQMSESEFAVALRDIYDALEPNIKAMVSWEYYLEQAKQNKDKFEPTLKASKATIIPLADPTYYGKVGCLRLFDSIVLDNLWINHGEQHQGIAVELDIQHEFFTGKTCEKGPQMFQSVVYDDLRPPMPSSQQPFPALFTRPEHLAYEREWRLVRPLKVAMKDEAMKCPKAVIKSLNLGLHCSTAIAEEIAQLVKLDLQFRHVTLRQMAVSETHLRLQPLDLNKYL